MATRWTGLEAATVGFRDGPPALRGVTVLAAPGEVLAVVGPSGCGKTTLLRAVAGFAEVQAGKVLVAGRDVTARPTADRDVAAVFRPDTLRAFLDLVVGPATGSGPRRRPPAAFLLDEPFARLDAGERARIRRAVVAAARASGVAALYVTHDQAEAMAMADRLAVLRDGEVVQCDHPRQMYQRPIDAFVAGFLGAGIGLLPARVVASNGLAGFGVGSRTLPLWGPPPAGLDVGQRVLLGLRPEDVGAAGPGADPASVTLPVLVRRVEHPGPETIVVAALDVPGEGDGAQIVARLDPVSALRAGERTELVVDARRAHVFDPDSGRALVHPG